MRKVVGIFLLIGGIALYAGMRVGLTVIMKLASVHPLFAIALFFLWLFLCFGLLKPRRMKELEWRRWFAPYAGERQAKDTRPPLLLLRGFDDDHGMNLHELFGGTTTLEQVLVKCLATYGPVIAIGRPDEWSPPLGAARVYVGDDWRETVLRITSQSQRVVIILGQSEGLLWEIEQIISNRFLPQAILVLPPVGIKKIFGGAGKFYSN